MSSNINKHVSMDKNGKRVSMDYSQILNEGAVLRDGSVQRRSSDHSTAFSSALDDADAIPLAPRGSKSTLSIKQNQKYCPSTSSLSNDDRNLERTLTNIKTMSLMFEKGPLPVSARPNSLSSADDANSSMNRAVSVTEAPPRQTSSMTQRDRIPDDNSLSRNSDHHFSANINRTFSVTEHAYVRGLEHRVEKLEAMLEDLQHRLDSVLASHESTKIPSKHDPAPNQVVKPPSENFSHDMTSQHEYATSDKHDQVSGGKEIGEHMEPSSRTSGNMSSARRRSMQAVTLGMMFARRLHLPAISQMPSFDPSVCSEGILLQNMNSLATLIQFSNTPHPYCLGPIISRGTSILSIALYFGEPALPSISDSVSLANLQSILVGGSRDDIAHAIISSPPDVLSQALKLSDSVTLHMLSKQFGVTIRTDKNFKLRCDDLRRSCRDIARDAANVGVCYFGVCGASVPSHGIRGEEMVWCSSINERKEPGALKMKPLVGKDDKIAALETHIELLLSDLATICDAIPSCGDFLSTYIPRRRTDADAHSHIQWSNLWNDAGGQKQVSSMWSFLQYSCEK
jgi:hypothetical protein